MNYKLNLLGEKIPSVPLGPFLSTYDCDICYNITKSTCPSPTPVPDLINQILPKDRGWSGSLWPPWPVLSPAHLPPPLVNMVQCKSPTGQGEDRRTQGPSPSSFSSSRNVQLPGPLRGRQKSEPGKNLVQGLAAMPRYNPGWEHLAFFIWSWTLGN